jgi:hypothetical protein
MRRVSRTTWAPLFPPDHFRKDNINDSLWGHRLPGAEWPTPRSRMATPDCPIQSSEPCWGVEFPKDSAHHWKSFEFEDLSKIEAILKWIFCSGQ